MSIDSALTALAQRLRTMTVPQPLRKVYDDPKWATSIGEFPCAILSLSPGPTHTWRQAASGFARQDYSMTIWLFVGQMDTPIGELHSRAIQWPQPLAAALFSGVTLGGAVEWIGDFGAGGDTLYTYTMGPIAWANQQQNYFGLTITLPVTEKISMAMDA